MAASEQDDERGTTLTGRLGDAWRALSAKRTPPVHAPPAASVDIPLPIEGIDALIGGLPQPAIVLGPDGRVIAFNAPAASIAPALQRGEPASIVLRMPDLVNAIRRAGETHEVQRVEFFERVPLDRWFEAFVTPIRLGSDGLVVMTFNDLTPWRRVEEMRADFVANASHELRTPLAALLGFVETLQGPAKNDPAAREKFLAIMQAQATRMARLIDDLLSLSRIELNAHVKPDKPVDLVPIARQVVDGLQMLAHDRGVEIDVALPAAAVVVAGDRDELIRALENLVENALKYGARGKRVEVTLARSESAGAPEAQLTVRDYGPGIAREHLPRLTERFYRVDATDSRAQGGTGLGLALVKHILNRHGGRLAIESTPGEGASFRMHLPLPAAASV
jgi:two-component system phosphate regulon sensor histidine kinase PhoR